MQDTLDAIRAAHRERVYAMEARKSADLRMLAFLRTQAGWRLDLPEKERKAIAERAKAFADGGEDAGLEQWRSVVEASTAARKPFDEIEARALKEMERLAQKLPVWESFGEPIRGFGPASLAVIVAEVGDLNNYANPAKIWKRMGLAVLDGKRQGGLPKTASAEEWIAHGYTRKRRSLMWNIGDALIKGNRDGEYRTLYLQRKDYEVARDPEMKPIQAHRRAQRVMEKALLRDLWVAWRETKEAVKPKVELSPAENSNQQASRPVQPIRSMPAAATGQSMTEPHHARAGRSPSSSEALDEVLPTSKPRRRRAIKVVKPRPQVPGAISNSRGH
jgi:hypothetical protein